MNLVSIQFGCTFFSRRAVNQDMTLFPTVEKIVLSRFGLESLVSFVGQTGISGEVKQVPVALHVPNFCQTSDRFSRGTQTSRCAKVNQIQSCLSLIHRPANMRERGSSDFGQMNGALPTWLVDEVADEVTSCPPAPHVLSVSHVLSASHWISTSN